MLAYHNHSMTDVVYDDATVSESRRLLAIRHPEKGVSGKLMTHENAAQWLYWVDSHTSSRYGRSRFEEAAVKVITTVEQF